MNNTRPSLDSIFTPEVISGNAPPKPSLDSIFASKPQLPTTPEPVQQPSLVQKNQATIKQHGENIVNDIKGTSPESQRENPLVRGFQATGEAFGAVGDVANNLIPQGVKDTVGNLSSKFASLFDVSPKQQDNFNKVINDWSTAHPDAARNLDSVLKTLSSSGTIAQTIAGAEGAAKVGTEIAEKAPGALKTLDDKVGKINKGASSVNKVQKELDTISEKISPKPTAKEAKLAQSQGRLVKGKEPTLFKSGTPDEVIPTKDMQRATGTIQREIPGAAKMDDASLTDAIKTKVEEKAQALQPELQAVKINPATIEKINTDWEKLKQTQLKNADASEEANVAKRQAQFQEKLMKSGSGTLDDLWTTAKDYDASVPDAVKKANSMSSESLLNKKEEWLQNRAILKDAINDSKNGLGKTSQTAFSDMTDLYHAKEGLISKAKIETTAKPSKIKNFIKKNPYISGAIGGEVAGEAIKKAAGL